MKLSLDYVTPLTRAVSLLGDQHPATHKRAKGRLSPIPMHCVEQTPSNPHRDGAVRPWPGSYHLSLPMEGILSWEPLHPEPAMPQEGWRLSIHMGAGLGHGRGLGRALQGVGIER